MTNRHDNPSRNHCQPCLATALCVTPRLAPMRQPMTNRRDNPTRDRAQPLRATTLAETSCAPTRPSNSGDLPSPPGASPHDEPSRFDPPPMRLPEPAERPTKPHQSNTARSDYPTRPLPSRQSFTEHAKATYRPSSRSCLNRTPRPAESRNRNPCRATSRVMSSSSPGDGASQVSPHLGDHPTHIIPTRQYRLRPHQPQRLTENAPTLSPATRLSHSPPATPKRLAKPALFGPDQRDDPTLYAPGSKGEL